MEFSFISLVIILIALLHFWFLILEMFLWTKPLGVKIFHLTDEFAQKSAALAMNQGLYNGFLSAGLIWSIFAPAPFAFELKLFFLSCVLVAGIFGAITVNKHIFWVQGLPALVGLLLLWLFY